MYVFIDSTEYRRFLSPEPETETLKALKKLLERKPKKGEEEVVLIVTDQVLDEYYRAESQRAHESRTQHTKKEFAIKIDQLNKEESVQEQSIRNRSNDLQSSFEKLRDKRVGSFDKKIEETKNLISKLFSLATRLDCNENIFKKAEMRIARGIHPRRSSEGSIGDAINWELLLAHSDNSRYIIITQDKDFLDELGKLHRTLVDDWGNHHTKKLEVFPFIGKFIESIKGDGKKLSSRIAAKKATKKTSTKKIEKNTLPGTGIDAYISRSVPSFTLESDSLLAQVEPRPVSDESVGIWNLWHGPFTSSESVVNDIKCCPFCQADRSYIGEDFTAVYFGTAKHFSCGVCGRKFSLD